MIAYLLSSVLLSWVGLLVYVRWIREKAPARRQKQFIVATVAASLLFPLLVIAWAPAPQFARHSIHELAFTGPVSEAQLQQYCQCASPNYSHRLLYRSNALYHFLLRQRGWIAMLTLLAACAIILKSLLEFAYLGRVVRQSQKAKVQSGAGHFTMLYPRRAMGAGAFWLGRPYLIWQPELAQLSEAERMAVFRHELSHIRQGNTFDKIAFRLLQCLWWFNPAFYRFRREWALLSEYLADDAALQGWNDKKAYARLLLRLAAPTSLPYASGLSSGSLERRIRRLLATPTTHQQRSIFPLLLLILILQGAMAYPLSAAFIGSVQDISTYQVLVYEQPATRAAVVFCPDCESVCVP